jgi:hypothetical protein
MPAGLKRDRESRRAMRYPTRFPAAVKAAGRTLPVTVHDISTVGVMVEGAQLPEVGRSVTFEAVGLSVEATVAWSREKACGLEFRQPVDPLDAVRKNVPALAQARGQRSPKP